MFFFSRQLVWIESSACKPLQNVRKLILLLPAPSTDYLISNNAQEVFAPQPSPTTFTLDKLVTRVPGPHGGELLRYIPEQAKCKPPQQ